MEDTAFAMFTGFTRLSALRDTSLPSRTSFPELRRRTRCRLRLDCPVGISVPSEPEIWASDGVPEGWTLTSVPPGVNWFAPCTEWNRRRAGAPESGSK